MSIGAKKYYITHGQVLIFDRENDGGLLWESEHEAQGFVRDGVRLHVATMIDSGEVLVRVIESSCLPSTVYDRAMSTPISLPTGQVIVCEPEDLEGLRTHVQPGTYRVFVGQTVPRTPSEEYEIDIVLIRPDPLPLRSFDHSKGVAGQGEGACREDAQLADC